MRRIGHLTNRKWSFRGTRKKEDEESDGAGENE
jgi:hypothetical protein